MTDAEYEAEQERVKGIFARWIGPLGLKWWNLALEFSRENASQSAEDAAESWRTIAKCTAKWQYMQAAITVYLPQTQGLTDEELERHCLHELMHVFVNETRQADDDWLKHEERVVSQLTNAFLWFRDSMTAKSNTDAN